MNRESNESKNSIIKDYQIFDLTPAHELLLEVPVSMDMKRGIICLSGPPKSGKSTILTPFLLGEFGPAAKVFSPSAELYRVMRLCGLRETHLPYAEFKALPFARERLNAAAEIIKRVEPDLFLDLITSSAEWAACDLPIIDNTGFKHELDYFGARTDSPLLIEVVNPHNASANDEIQNMLTMSQGGVWRGDSRQSLAGYASFTWGPKHYYCGHNAVKACESIKRLALDAARSDSIWIAGTTFGLMHKLWIDSKARPVVRDLFDQSQASEASESLK